MAKVTITITEDGDMLDVSTVFDPPAAANGPATKAHFAALVMLQALSKLRGPGLDDDIDTDE